jgi:hypothetical protein
VSLDSRHLNEYRESDTIQYLCRTHQQQTNHNFELTDDAASCWFTHNSVEYNLHYSSGCGLGNRLSVGLLATSDSSFSGALSVGYHVVFNLMTMDAVKSER